MKDSSGKDVACQARREEDGLRISWIIDDMAGEGNDKAIDFPRPLIDRDDLDGETIARRAMEIAAGICVYTNNTIVIEKLEV